MKISIEDISAEELLAVAMVLNNVTDKVVTPSNAPVIVNTDDVVGVAEEEVVEEPSGDTMDFDKEGLPWDERIHSSNHKLTAQGVWQRRRGITDEVYNAVKAELLAKWGSAEPITEETPVIAPAPAQAPVFAPAPVAAPAPIPAPAPVAPAFTPVQQVQAPVTAQAPVVAPAPVQAPVAQVSLYETLMNKLKIGLDNKLIEANYMLGLLNTVNTTFGTSYQGMFELRDREDVMQFVINELAKKGI